MIFKSFNFFWKNSQLTRFLFVGGTTVLIDFTFYSLLFFIGINTQFAKGFGFLIGTIFAYFANRKITFRSSHSGILRFILFSLLYISTLIVNVVTNEVVLYILTITKMTYLLAFLIATTLSAAMNFLGMKYFIFPSQK